MSVDGPKLRYMGKYRGGSRQKPWETADLDGRTLDAKQFPELSARFYSARPANFITLRVNMLSLLACSADLIAPAFASERRIGNIRMSGTDLPNDDDRECYLQMESLMIVHHASEALLRLFFAHIDHPECPWIGMSASSNFNDFKDRIGEALRDGFEPSDVAMVFLGGRDPQDAAIALSQEEFGEAVEGVARLLEDCATRVLDDAFLYNGAKHGLTAVTINDKSARLDWSQGDKRVTLHRGPIHMFLHRLRFPMAKKNEKEWFYTMADSNPERDLAVTKYIAAAMGSLWAVARRRYIGHPGSILCMTRGAVETAIYSPVNESLNIMKRMTSELVKVNTEGEAEGPFIDLEPYDIPEDWEAVDPADQKCRRVQLPVRLRDRKIHSTSTQAYLPVVPKGFQQA